MGLRIFALSVFCFCLAPFSAMAQQQNPSAQGSIEGRTLSADGQPLRKTNVTLRPIAAPQNGGGGGAGGAGFQPPAPYATTSDAQGKFSFTGLDAGRYTLMGDHAGYINTQYGVKRSSGGVQSGNPVLNLTAGQHMTGVDIELTPQATISGKVTDEDGDPMPRIRVSAVRKMYALGGARLVNAATATSDDNGDYHLTALTAGRYYVSFAPQRQNPLQAARRAGNDASAPELGYANSYFPGAPDMESAVGVDAAEGQDKAGINVRMRKVPIYHIRGTVGGELPAPDPTMPAGMAMNRLQISVMAPGSTMLGMNMQMMNADGSFDVGGLTPGVWTVSVMRAQGQLQTLVQSTVVISNHDVTDLNLMARNAVDIAGTVRIVPEDAVVAAPSGQSAGQQGQAPGRASNQASGQPAARARVTQVSLDSADGVMMGANVQPAKVADDGSFVLKGVGPLKYRVFANAPQGGYVKSATINGQDALGAGADMSSGGRLELVVSMTAAEIDGTVTNAEGQPATDAIITIVPDPAQPGRRDIYRQARTRADGSFTAMGIAPGKYRVYAWEELEPGSYLDPDYMKPFESLGASVSVDDSDKKTVTVAEISKANAADVNHRAGR